jgi:aryl-alcohol dehydrogenase-like predicted oxidoreductase
MEYRFLGGTGLRVSVISLGTMTFGGDEAIRGVDLPLAQRLFDIAVGQGVNLIDTADIYSGGESEELVGQIIKDRRDDLVLATKVRFGDRTQPNATGLTRDHIVRGCENSLRRLRTDRIDLYQMHGWDGRTDIHEVLSAMDDLVRQGKIRSVGCSNFSGWHVLKTTMTAKQAHLTPLGAHQLYYSLIGREAERELLPAAIDQNLGVLVWSPLAGGLLTGKYRRDHDWPSGGRRSQDWDEPPIEDWDYVYDVIEVLIQVADQAGCTPAQAALAYVLSRPAITSVIVGARRETQLIDTLAAADVSLTAEHLARLDEVSRRPLPYPYWHQTRTIVDRVSVADEVALGLSEQL